MFTPNCENDISTHNLECRLVKTPFMSTKFVNMGNCTLRGFKNNLRVGMNTSEVDC